jgi:hypothetical protein
MRRKPPPSAVGAVDSCEADRVVVEPVAVPLTAFESDRHAVKCAVAIWLRRTDPAIRCLPSE